MTHFALDALDARKGDALVLRWGSEDGGSHVALIDGGPDTIYGVSVLPHLRDTFGQDPLGRQNPVKLDLVVVSHVDDDHIQGIIDLANDIATTRAQSRTHDVSITEVWHNAFDDVASAGEFAQEPDLRAAIGAVSGDPNVLGSVATLDANTPPSGLAAEALSVNQGRTLDRALDKLGVPRNTTFADRENFARDGKPVSVAGLKVTVLCPNTVLLAKLEKKWKAELAALDKKTKAKGNSIAALAAALDDPSISNQSSIVLFVEFEGKSMLLTGDARGDHILDALRPGPGKDPKPLHVNLYKVGHHGSIHSNSRKLFETVTADHYVISGNGEHGNPHPDTLRFLFKARKGTQITVYLTNRPQVGAKTADDKAKAAEAQNVLDAAAKDPNVTIRYRDPADRAITVALI